jgi:hypothetical protein
MRTFLCLCVPAGDNHADARCASDWACARVYALCCHRNNIFLLIPLEEQRGIVAGSDYGYFLDLHSVGERSRKQIHVKR